MANNYKKWLHYKKLDTNLKQELRYYENDLQLQDDAFSKYLEFGTAGIRGVVGPGTNRLNIYTIRRVSQGMADYIKQFGNDAMHRGVVIAYDSRRLSQKFAEETAKTLAINGVKTFIYTGPRTTPQLSYSVRKLKAFMGIVITASHNPPTYNGFKVYGNDGAQLNTAATDAVIKYIAAIEDELALPNGNFQRLMDQGFINLISTNLDNNYLNELTNIQYHPGLLEETSIKTVFTPLHGASGETVQKIFEYVRYKNIFYVEEQLKPDGNFPTLKTLNPEEYHSFTYAICKGQQVNADILMAADPDGDRIGLAVKADQQYKLLTGNQIGAILLDYILSQLEGKGAIPTNAIVFKSIVTSELGYAISANYNVQIEDVLIGFKFIGEKIKLLENDPCHRFLFGYEESSGFLIQDFCRDKDAMQAIIAITEAAAFYIKQNKTLLDVLNELYKKYGYFLEDQISVIKEGVVGSLAIQSALNNLRQKPLKEIAGVSVIIQEDYLTGIRSFKNSETIEEIVLPLSNILKFYLEDGSWICVRPSGTEPKIKYYFGVKSASAEESLFKLEKLKKDFSSLMENNF